MFVVAYYDGVIAASQLEIIIHNNLTGIMGRDVIFLPFPFSVPT